jgi:hypothetical protein
MRLERIARPHVPEHVADPVELAWEPSTELFYALQTDTAIRSLAGRQITIDLAADEAINRMLDALARSAHRCAQARAESGATEFAGESDGEPTTQSDAIRRPT